MELQFSSNRLIMVHIKFCITLSKNIKSYGAKMYLILFIIKGYDSLNISHGIKVLFSAHPLIMVYICTKIRKNILNGFRVMERTQFQY